MNYTSEEFRIQYVSSYTLYVSTDHNVDRLAIVDEHDQILVYMSYDPAHPSQEAMKLLSLPFQTVYITLPHQHLIWVPSEVFAQEGVAAFSPFFDDVKPEYIYDRPVANLGITALYTFDVLQTNRWRNIFEEAKFVPVFEVVLNQVLPQVPLQGEVLGVHIYDNRADLVVFADGKFRFYNSFDVTAVEDLSYFVLQVFKNFGIDKHIAKIILSGASLQSDWAACLAGYTDNLEMIKTKNTWLSSSAEVDTQTAVLNVLVDSVLCVS